MLLRSLSILGFSLFIHLGNHCVIFTIKNRSEEFGHQLRHVHALPHRQHSELVGHRVVHPDVTTRLRFLRSSHPYISSDHEIPSQQCDNTIEFMAALTRVQQKYSNYC